MSNETVEGRPDKSKDSRVKALRTLGTFIAEGSSNETELRKAVEALRNTSEIEFIDDLLNSYATATACKLAGIKRPEFEERKAPPNETARVIDYVNSYVPILKEVLDLPPSTPASTPAAAPGETSI